MILTLAIVTSTARALINEKGRDFLYDDTELSSGCFYAPIPEMIKLLDEGTTTAKEGEGIFGGFNVSKVNLLSVDADSAKHKTGCIVGEILKRCGMLTNEIKVCGNTIGSLCSSRRVKTDSAYTILFLVELQAAQDRRKSWGEAYDIAISAVSSRMEYDLRGVGQN